MQNTILNFEHVIPQEGITIFNPVSRRYYTLDAVATLVWRLIQQPMSLSEICDAIMDVFEVEEDYCERDVLRLLEEMEAEGLIEEKAS
jgi:Coenzyme PQQ synthesis protein D (PqqD)